MNNSKSVNDSTEIYLCNSVDWLLPSVFSVHSSVPDTASRNMGEVSAASSPLGVRDFIGKIRPKHEINKRNHKIDDAVFLALHLTKTKYSNNKY